MNETSNINYKYYDTATKYLQKLNNNKFVNDLKTWVNRFEYCSIKL